MIRTTRHRAAREETSALLAARERELGETQRFLEHLLASSPGLVVRLSGTGFAPSYVSSNIARVLGYTPEEACAAPTWWLEHIHPEQREPLVAEARQAMRRRVAQVEQEWHFRHQDGTYRDLYAVLRPDYDATGQPLSLVLYLLDLTEQKQAADALRASEERLARMIETMVNGVVLYDRDGRVTLANAAAARMMGLERRRIVDSRYDVPLLRRLTLDGQPFPLEDHPFARVQRTGQPLADVEMLLERPDGVQTIISVNAAPLHDAGGAFAGMVVSTTDITERQRTAAALAAAMAAAEQANVAKSEFLSRMSHELRTPLNAILGFAQLLELDPLDAEQQESVGHILKAGRHLLDLINEVLDLARIEAGRLALSPEPVPVRDLLRETLALVQPLAAPRQIALPVEGAAACDQHVVADRQRLKQVLLNLLANAVKYNRPAGSVAVACTYGDASPGRLRIAVQDTGPGIAPDQLDRLFVPFDRLGADQTSVEGTGLGLALARRLVEAMGGTIGVESVVGQGSTFWVEFPLVESPVARLERLGADALPLPVAAPATQPRRTVLYVEDNLSNLQLVQRILRHRPQVELLPAMQGRLGVELAREHRPDLILLDLHLPDIGGEQVLRQVQDDPVTAAIPVVMISADATPRQVERLLAAGACAYLTKPLDIPQLLAVLDEHLDAHRKAS